MRTYAQTTYVVIQVMVANIRCAEIMEEQLRSLAEDQAWASLRQESEGGLVPNFGSRAGALLDSCITGQSPAWNAMRISRILHGNGAMKAAILPVLGAQPSPTTTPSQHWLHTPELCSGLSTHNRLFVPRGSAGQKGSVAALSLYAQGMSRKPGILRRA